MLETSFSRPVRFLCDDRSKIDYLVETCKALSTVMSAQLGGGYHNPRHHRAAHRMTVAVKLPPIRIDLAVAERDRLVARQPSSARSEFRTFMPPDTPRRSSHQTSACAMEYGGGFLSPRAPAPAVPCTGSSRASSRRRPHRSRARQIRKPASATARQVGT